VGGLVLQSPLRGKELGMFHVKHFSQVFGSLLTGRKPCGRAQSLYCAFSLAGGRAAQYAIRVKNAHGYCTLRHVPRIRRALHETGCRAQSLNCTDFLFLPAIGTIRHPREERLRLLRPTIRARIRRALYEAGCRAQSLYCADFLVGGIA